MLKKLAAAALVALFFLSAGAARARIGDFAVRPGISVGSTVTAMDFSPDGRFLVILSGLPGKVIFLDTWDMALLSGATAEVAVAESSDQALSLTVSPVDELPFAYVGLSTGEVVVIDYTKVAELAASEDLVEALPLTTFQMETSGNPVTMLAAVPEYSGRTAGIYLLAGAPAATYPVIFCRMGGGNIPGAIGYSEIQREPVAVARGAAYGYIHTRDTDGSRFLHIITCSDNNRLCPVLSSLRLDGAAGDSLSGLVVDRAKDVYSVIMNRTEKNLYLVNNFFGPTIPKLADSFTVADAVAVASMPTPFDPYMGDVVLAAGGETISVSALTSTGIAFGGSYSALNAGQPVTTLVASGGSEGYAFAGSPDGSVIPFTANPWVTSFSAGAQVGNTVIFSFSATTEASGLMHYNFFKNLEFGKWPESVSGTVLPGGTVASANLNVSELKECENDITLIVQDSSGRQGRAVTTVTRDTNPPSPSFNLGFGRQRAIISFTASDLCDLDYYEVYWGDTNTLPVADYWLLEPHGGKVTITGPNAGERIEEIISGLTDGQRYWVQVVAFDETGNAGVGPRLSTVPQAVNTLSDASGEDGGFDCLGSVGGGRGGDPRGLFGLLLPLLIYAMARVARGQKP